MDCLITQCYPQFSGRRQTSIPKISYFPLCLLLFPVLLPDDNLTIVFCVCKHDPTPRYPVLDPTELPYFPKRADFNLDIIFSEHR